MENKVLQINNLLRQGISVDMRRLLNNNKRQGIDTNDKIDIV